MATKVTKLVPLFDFVLLADHQSVLPSLSLSSVGSSYLVYLGKFIFSFLKKSHIKSSQKKKNPHIKDCIVGILFSEFNWY